MKTTVTSILLMAMEGLPATYEENGKMKTITLTSKRTDLIGKEVEVHMGEKLESVAVEGSQTKSAVVRGAQIIANIVITIVAILGLYLGIKGFVGATISFFS